VTLRKYWEDTSRVLSLFLNSYLRSELNGSKKPYAYFIKLNGITDEYQPLPSRVLDLRPIHPAVISLDK
jgi:hypothetical protein